MTLGACDPGRSYYVGELEPLPVAGATGVFAASIDGHLIVGGGVWREDEGPGAPSDAIWSLDYRRKGRAWKREPGRLPRALTFGTSVEVNGGALWIGGLASSAAASVATSETFFVRWKDGGVQLTPGPALPEARASAVAARVASRVFVSCGNNAAEQATQTLFVLDLAAKDPTWARGPDLPGPARAMAMAGVIDATFYVVGGRGTAVLADAWAFDGQRWQSAPMLDAPVCAAPTPLLSVHDQVLVVGGDADGVEGGQAPGPRLRSLAKDGEAWRAWPDLTVHRGPDPDQHPELGTLPQVLAPVVRIDDFHAIVAGSIARSRSVLRAPVAEGPSLTSTNRIALFVAGDADSKRALLVLLAIFVLAVVPTCAAVAYAFRVHARKQAAS